MQEAVTATHTHVLHSTCPEFFVRAKGKKWSISLKATSACLLFNFSLSWVQNNHPHALRWFELKKNGNHLFAGAALQFIRHLMARCADKEKKANWIIECRERNAMANVLFQTQMVSCKLRNKTGTLFSWEMTGKNLKEQIKKPLKTAAPLTVYSKINKNWHIHFAFSLNYQKRV